MVIKALLWLQCSVSINAFFSLLRIFWTEFFLTENPFVVLLVIVVLVKLIKCHDWWLCPLISFNMFSVTLMYYGCVFAMLPHSGLEVQVQLLLTCDDGNSRNNELVWPLWCWSVWFFIHFAKNVVRFFWYKLLIKRIYSHHGYKGLVALEVILWSISVFIS